MMKMVIRTIFILSILGINVFAQNQVQLIQIAGNLNNPVLVTTAKDGSNRLFIIEQPGRILVMPPGAVAPLPTPFLDLTSKVSFSGERGLLGLAFHPQYSINRRFFVNYTRTSDGATVVSEFKVSTTNANVAETAEKIIITVSQPFSNHNGGMIDFGADGFLYIGMGDGGSGNDPGNRAQNIDDLLGKMLRIDINNTSGSVNYVSPADNPFFGPVAGRDEIYAVGLRNPWRWSFDRSTGQLWAGDVGQNQIEEISVITRGGNFGWRVYEGRNCTNLDAAKCIPANFIPPVYQYDHSGGRCSVTGGYVYRGIQGTFPAGTYVFGDYCTGEIFLLKDNNFSIMRDTSLLITSFGEDESGELYVVGQGGSIFRLAIPASAAVGSAASYQSTSLSSESIGVAFASNMATITQSAPDGQPLPNLLAGLSIRVRDDFGNERAAPLFYVSPNQVNFLVPPSTSNGPATLTLSNVNGAVFSSTIPVATTSAGIFSADSTGRGIAAAQVLRVKPDGAQSYEPVAQFDPVLKKFNYLPIDFGPASDEVYLVLYGTGFRNRNNLSAVTATVGGQSVQVTFAGLQVNFFGLDQANLRLPRSLAGRGEVDVLFNVNTQSANIVKVSFK
ncbi:MAG: PQQ-dependent sugar dehydrogenase [Acidobacteria bacterium]|nr:PQQ-dependent sugar dehydrogenase [Acidobacteriota bacterium]